MDIIIDDVYVENWYVEPLFQLDAELTEESADRLFDAELRIPGYVISIRDQLGHKATIERQGSQRDALIKTLVDYQHVFAVAQIGVRQLVKVEMGIVEIVEGIIEPYLRRNFTADGGPNDIGTITEEEWSLLSQAPASPMLDVTTPAQAVWAQLTAQA